MATIALIHGGGDSASSWGPASLQLRELGHTPVAVDLPIEDPNASWPEHARAVASSLKGKNDVVVVGHSFGGFIAPLVCEHVPVQKLILVAAMIPVPGAIAGNYWADARYGQIEFDDETFYHDLSSEARSLARAAERAQADRSTLDPWPLSAWPNVPTHYLLCRNDRALPAAVTRRVVRDRLGIEPDEIDAGHCVQLAKPVELAKRIHDYVRGSVP